MHKDSAEMEPEKGGRKDLLVVGAGLAGSLFAAEAALAGHRVVLYDLPNPRSASRVAAGLYNIVTGRFAILTWQARTLLDSLEKFLSQPAFQPLRQYFHRMPIFRPYRDAEDFNEWAALSQTPAYAGLVEHVDPPIFPEEIRNPLGGLRILPCGWVDVPGFLDALHGILQDEFKVELRKEGFPYAEFDPQSGWLGETHQFDAAVFAEGVSIRANPWFDYVEVRPLKGQIITFTAAHWDPDFAVLNKGFIIPLGNGQFNAGSTYEHTYQDDLPTAAAQEQLHAQVNAALHVPTTVTAIRSGIRPTSPNLRPILGRHPHHPRLHILNGLGTKGLLQAPWCAALLRAWMDGEETMLPESVDVARFLPKFAVT